MIQFLTDLAQLLYLVYLSAHVVRLDRRLSRLELDHD